MMRPFYIFIIGFAVGVALRSLFPADSHGALGGSFSFALFLLVLGGAFLVYTLVRKQTRVFTPASFLVGIFLVATGLGVLRFDSADIYKGDPILDTHVGEEVVLQGVVVDEPDVREKHTSLTFLPRTSQFTGHPMSSELGGKSRVRVFAEHFPKITYGDEMIVRGTLVSPKNFELNENEPGRPFNYVAYLEKDGIFYQIFYPEIDIMAHDEGNAFRGALFSFKNSLIDNTHQVLREPHASLLGGILLGAKHSLGESLLDAFRATGIIHIVVLSGYNITIVADSIGRIAAFLPRAIGVGLSLGAIASFALMVGAGATVVRASIMALLVLLARISGRTYEITIALFVAGFVMVLWNPKILLFDPSFQLSFMATFGLIVLAPKLEQFFGFDCSVFNDEHKKSFTRTSVRGKVREVFFATLATQIFVLPLLIYMMGEFSIVALPVNLLILLFIPATMLFGFLTMSFGFFGVIASLPFAWITYVLLEYELGVVNLFNTLPFASVSIRSFPLWIMTALYVCYGILIYKLYSQKVTQPLT
jgi:competence protein ComEC